MMQEPLVADQLIIDNWYMFRTLNISVLIIIYDTLITYYLLPITYYLLPISVMYIYIDSFFLINLAFLSFGCCLSSL
jgi:hypothetical protein